MQPVWVDGHRQHPDAHVRVPRLPQQDSGKSQRPVTEGLGLGEVCLDDGSFSCLGADLSDPDAVRLQVALSGTNVNEHRSSHDDIIEQNSQSADRAVDIYEWDWK